MAAFLLNVLKVSRIPLLWISSSANRKRLRGARVEIIALLLTRTPTPSILMVQSVYDDCWMPPQEGVNFRETLTAALARGIREECAFSIEKRAGELKDNIYLRDIKYLGMLPLPPERWGERSVAGNVEDTIFSHITMRRKAYWTAALILPSRNAVNPRVNPNELRDARWMTFEEARFAIKDNRPEKAALLDTAFQRALQHLLGAREKANWLAAH